MSQKSLGPQEANSHIGGSGPLLEHAGVEVVVRRRAAVQ